MMSKNPFSIFSRVSTIKVVLLFLVFDALATGCYLLYLEGVLDSRFFKLGRDRGLFELIEYIKFGGIIYLLHVSWKATNAPLLKAWVILFVVMLVDNMAGLHEEFGGLIADNIPLPDVGLGRPKDLGEIIMLGLMEGTALLYVIYRYFQSEKVHQHFSLALIGLVIFLATFSILLDALHMFVLEESFEILGMTLLVGFVHYRYLRYRGEFGINH